MGKEMQRPPASSEKVNSMSIRLVKLFLRFHRKMWHDFDQYGVNAFGFNSAVSEYIVVDIVILVSWIITGIAEDKLKCSSVTARMFVLTVLTAASASMVCLTFTRKYYHLGKVETKLRDHYSSDIYQRLRENSKMILRWETLKLAMYSLDFEDEKTLNEKLNDTLTCNNFSNIKAILERLDSAYDIHQEIATKLLPGMKGGQKYRNPSLKELCARTGETTSKKDRISTVSKKLEEWVWRTHLIFRNREYIPRKEGWNKEKHSSPIRTENLEPPFTHVSKEQIPDEPSEDEMLRALIKEEIHKIPAKRLGSFMYMRAPAPLSIESRYFPGRFSCAQISLSRSTSKEISRTETKLRSRKRKRSEHKLRNVYYYEDVEESRVETLQDSNVGGARASDKVEGTPRISNAQPNMDTVAEKPGCKSEHPSADAADRKEMLVGKCADTVRALLSELEETFAIRSGEIEHVYSYIPLMTSASFCNLSETPTSDEISLLHRVLKTTEDLHLRILSLHDNDVVAIFDMLYYFLDVLQTAALRKTELETKFEIKLSAVKELCLSNSDKIEGLAVLIESGPDTIFPVDCYDSPSSPASSEPTDGTLSSDCPTSSEPEASSEEASSEESSSMSSASQSGGDVSSRTETCSDESSMEQSGGDDTFLIG